MNGYYEFAKFCPGCGIPLLAGAIVDVIEAARQYNRVYGLMDDVEPDSCDAVYLGDLFRSDEEKLCPRCGANPIIETAKPIPPATRGDDSDFLEELVVDLELSVPTRNTINRAGAKKIGDILNLSVNDLERAARRDADANIEEIRGYLALRGLRLKGD